MSQTPDLRFPSFSHGKFTATCCLATLVAALLAAPAAMAQAAAAGPPLGGPAVPGVCLLSQEAVLSGSKVGQAATARLRALAQTAQGSLESERQAMQAEATSLEADRAKLPIAQLNTRQQALSQRAQAYQAHVQEMSRRIEATRLKAVQRISVSAQPVVAQAYQAKGCGLLLARGIVLGGNMSGDLTPAVAQGLDSRMTTITFDLEPPAPTAAPAR